MLIKDLETINHLLKIMDDLLVLRCKDNPLLLIRILVYLGYKESLQEHVYVSDLKYTFNLNDCRVSRLLNNRLRVYTLSCYEPVATSKKPIKRYYLSKKGWAYINQLTNYI